MSSKIKCYLLVFLLLVTTRDVKASWFQPSVSLIGNYTITHNEDNIHSGLFRITNRKFNGGLGLYNDFKLSPSFFIQTGVRYNTYSTTLHAENQVAGFFDNPDPFTWERHYLTLIIPLNFHKALNINNAHPFDVFGGLAAGIMMQGYAKTEAATPFARNLNNTDLIKISLVDSSNQNLNRFFSTIDFGFNYQPFKNLPQLKVGLLCSFQISKISKNHYTGTVTNISKGQEYLYDMYAGRRYTDIGLTLTYSFKNKKAQREHASFSSPNPK